MPTTSGRLEALRNLMRERGLKAYYVPSEDAHQSEYIAKWDSRREFISGFTGSAGYAIITEDEAALWTDGRYFLQAEKQLDTNWKLMKAGIPGTPPKEEYLSRILKCGERVGVDAKTISFESAKKMQETLEKHQLELCLLAENLVDLVWSSDRPKIALNKVFSLPIEYSGKSSKEKIETLQKYLVDNKLFGFLVTALDEIGWLFNLRGSDIDCNPNFFSYALITKDDATSTLYLDPSKLEDKAKGALANVTIKDYHSVFDDLKGLRSRIEKANNEKLLISGTCNAALVQCIGADAVVCKASPVEMEKALKNQTEINGLRNCHVRDAAALIRYFAWLEEQLKKGVKVDEVDGADQLEAFRKEGTDFVGLSFDTISGAGPNGAVIHYKPEKPSALPITLDQLYLCDSGGQYLDGTTDVTRTVHFGEPTAEEKEYYTRVLLGNIALGKAVFPVGTTGFMLDCLARLPLWSAGLDYRHGTGHGVGHFLNVHEGPQSISFHIRSNEVSLKPGMTVTNEPGVYLDGRFGIRIENVLVVREAKTKNNFGGTKFLEFENLTIVPMCKKLLDLSIMTEKDIEWVNKLHQECWNSVSPLLQNDKRALEWLRHETLAISK